MHYNVVIDRTTGSTSIIGRDGHVYTGDEIDAARRLAAQGDAAAIEVLDNVDMTRDWADRDPREIARQLLHDCPECRAALARGEVPMIALPPPPKPKRWAKPRWRDRKRRR